MNESNLVPRERGKPPLFTTLEDSEISQEEQDIIRTQFIALVQDTFLNNFEGIDCTRGEKLSLYLPGASNSRSLWLLNVFQNEKSSTINLWEVWDRYIDSRYEYISSDDAIVSRLYYEDLDQVDEANPSFRNLQRLILSKSVTLNNLYDLQDFITQPGWKIMTSKVEDVIYGE